MSTTEELKGQLGKAQIQKLKALGNGIQVGKVMGRRVLVKLVTPYTAMDEVEKKGLLFIPETVKSANTPLPSTGVIVKLGEEFRLGTGKWKDGEWIPDNLLHEGDMVMFSRFAGTDFRVDEEQLRILNEDEIMCTLIDTNEVVVPVVE